ncbi:hypothetical protein INT44_008622 [Umbelopsis vinacea]|uniref:Uncharacterized protein n=1 Tax=Umbelopsis vinacea TaxID=44442 RepID=A0A8H7UHE0_9FUNG|nr:hypothetical protein INT44_008622 [Umbelopsis vinacea]
MVPFLANPFSPRQPIHIKVMLRPLTMPNMRLHTARPGLTGDMHTTTSPTDSRLYRLDKCSMATMSPSILNVGSMDGPMHYGN